MQNGTQRSENNSSFKNVGDRLLGVLQTVGADAWEELKTGIDKAWDEIKLGIDEGLNSASEGFNKAWTELSGSIERAKDDLLMKQGSEKNASSQTNMQSEDKSTSRSTGSKTRKDRLS